MNAAVTHLPRQTSRLRRDYGPVGTFKWFLSRAAKKALRLEVSEMVWLEIDGLPASIDVDPDFTFRFLTVDEIADLASDPAYELAPEFISRAAGNYDLCFAALDRDRQVAHYGWYALGSIEGRHHMGVAMSFPDDVAYMYNAFTHPDFRGRRLHGTAMALALSNLSTRGISHLLSTIEWTNFASLRSFDRLGFTKLGRLWTLGRGNRRRSLTPKAARLRGVRFGRQAQVQPRHDEELAPVVV